MRPPVAQRGLGDGAGDPLMSRTDGTAARIGRWAETALWWASRDARYGPTASSVSGTGTMSAVSAGFMTGGLR
jgi:hypothetical protein